MNIIYSALIEAAKDEGNSLATKLVVQQALQRFSLIAPIISESLIRSTNASNASQHSKWIGGLSDGRWLMIESSVYDQKTNSGRCTNDSTYNTRK